MSKDLLDSRALMPQLLTGMGPSVSRAGRNCAVGMTRKAADAAADGSPLSGRGTTYGTRRAGGPDLGVAGADDHKLAFGRGIATDDGKRHELCSSPRPHPLMDSYRIAEFAAGRLKHFDEIRAGIPGMELVDQGAVEDEIAYRHPAVVDQSAQIDPASSSEPMMPTMIADGTLHSNAHHHVDSGRNVTTPADAAAHTARLPAHLDAAHHGQAHVPHAPATARNRPAAASTKKAIPGSAAFGSPERFKEPPMRFRLPPVGHYRPKYKMVDAAPTGGMIVPAAAHHSRVPRAPEEKVPAPPLQEVLKRARDELKAKRPDGAASPTGSDAGAGFPAGAGGDASLDDLSGRRKKNAIPEPTRHNSPVFRSKVPNCAGIVYTSAAADAVYWPRHDGATMTTPRSHVDFEAQTPRPGPQLNAMSPSHGYNPSSFSPVDASNHTPRLGNYSPRQPIGTAKWPPKYAPVDVSKADPHTRPRAAVADLGKPSFDKPRNSTPPRVGVSVEAVDHIKDPAAKRIASPDMRRSLARPQLRAVGDLPPLTLNYDVTDHRLRVATIRAGGHGHDDVFTGNGSLTAEATAIDPNVNPVRPRQVRNIEFSKGLPRLEIKANIADLVYDVKPVSPRITGNPMINAQVSRAKREAVLGKVSGPADVVYDKPPPPQSNVGNGMIDFSRQVDRYAQCQGYGHPSQRTVDRERRERDAAFAAATAVA